MRGQSVNRDASRQNRIMICPNAKACGNAEIQRPLVRFLSQSQMQTHGLHRTAHPEINSSAAFLIIRDRTSLINLIAITSSLRAWTTSPTSGNLGLTRFFNASLSDNASIGSSNKPVMIGFVSSFSPHEAQKRASGANGAEQVWQWSAESFNVRRKVSI